MKMAKIKKIKKEESLRQLQKKLTVISVKEKQPRSPKNLAPNVPVSKSKKFSK